MSAESGGSPTHSHSVSHTENSEGERKSGGFPLILAVFLTLFPFLILTLKSMSISKFALTPML